DFLPKRRLPGIGIGLAAGLKLTPAFLGLVLLFQRRWWAAGISVVTFALTVGIGFITIPDAQDFWERAIFDSSRVGDHTNPAARSIRSILEREFNIEGGLWGSLATVGIMALSCIAVWLAAMRHNGAVAMALTGVPSCLMTTSPWYHHWMSVLPLQRARMLTANKWLGQRRPAILGAQIEGLGSFVVMINV